MSNAAPDSAHHLALATATASPNEPPLDQRRALLRCAAALLALGMPFLPSASQARMARRDRTPDGRPRSLWVTRPQAQECVRAVYWADGRIEPDGYAALNRIYRDLHAGAQRPIALGLLELNFALQAAVHAFYGRRPLVLVSGYRTRATNALVGGTRASAHRLGLADDFIYEGLTLLENLLLARRFQVGGLGVYPERGVLHKDVGALRSWVTRGRGRPEASLPTAPSS